MIKRVHQFLVADFGGTNARAALARVVEGRVELSRMRGEELASGQMPADWLAAYRASLGDVAITACAACAAGPLERDGDDLVVRFTNRAAEVRVSTLAAASGCGRALLVNDFAAVAHALPVLGTDDRIALGEAGAAVRGAPQLVLGPGTGLGVAIRVPSASGLPAVIVPGEGGHSALAPFDPETLRLWPRLAGKAAQLSAEQVLSGPGLQALHAACAQEAGLAAEADLSPSTISTRGLDGSDATCARAVRLFTRWLGHFAGGLALIGGVRGGVYIGGGIIPAWGAGFDRQAFRAAFEAQAAQRAYVRAIPTWLMRHPQPALAGLAAAAAGL